MPTVRPLAFDIGEGLLKAAAFTATGPANSVNMLTIAVASVTIPLGPVDGLAEVLALIVTDITGVPTNLLAGNLSWTYSGATKTITLFLANPTAGTIASGTTIVVRGLAIGVPN